MKQKLLLMILIFSINSFSQNSKFSIEANYPLPIDANFIGKNYDGIIDFGAKYRFAEFKNVTIGAGLNGGVLVFKLNSFGSNIKTKTTDYIIQPKVFAELKLDAVPKLHPFVALGYTTMLFVAKGTNSGVDVTGANETMSGFNTNFGMTIDINKKVFMGLQYDFVKLKIDSQVPQTTFNTNVNLLKIGLGLRL